jgi:FlaA1/EpsC-like NDP-sugar epimerase
MKNFRDFLFRRWGAYLETKKLMSSVFLSSCVAVIFAVSNVESIKDHAMEVSLFLLSYTVILFALGALRYLPGYIDFKIALSIIVAHISSPLVYGLFLFFKEGPVELFIGAILFAGLWMVLHLTILAYRSPQPKKGIPIGIYGAGIAGRELVSTMRQGSRYTPKYFIDDDENLWGCIHSGLPVYGWESVKQRSHESQVDMIFVAIPSLEAEQRASLLEKVSNLSVVVRFLPHVDELIGSQVTLSQLRSVTVDDILNRPEVRLRFPTENNTFEGKTALVTGGGGSIGLEVCIQLLGAGINELVVIDHSEFALVEAEEKLRDWRLDQKSEAQINLQLGTVLDPCFLEAVFQEKSIDFVFHAAAYKHVPILERNVIQGVKNNVLGTENLLKISASHGVRRFTLISTDKAVRPSNVMGASKRLCEAMCLKDSAVDNSMRVQVVRFGNVLGSSGSVLPLFLEQIKRGGPVTVTHRDIERFFMSIAEAASLVVRSSQIDDQDKLFILDMGAPIKILDFAKKLIKMHGFQPFVEGSSEVGNMEIQISGLRPGEKLYEELSLDNNLVATSTPKIFVSREKSPLPGEVEKVLAEIMRCIRSNDALGLRECFVKSFIGMVEYGE